jgi:E3 ubiquitin-protein ligase makorin
MIQISLSSYSFYSQCLRRWRDPLDKNDDVVHSGVNKKCPMCRSPSCFITPSSIFFKQGDPQKDHIVAMYMASMARVPCRYVVKIWTEALAARHVSDTSEPPSLGRMG